MTTEDDFQRALDAEPGGEHLAFYRTREDAITALGRAVVTWARKYIAENNP